MKIDKNKILAVLVVAAAANYFIFKPTPAPTTDAEIAAMNLVKRDFSLPTSQLVGPGGAAGVPAKPSVDPSPATASGDSASITGPSAASKPGEYKNIEESLARAEEARKKKALAALEPPAEALPEVLPEIVPEAIAAQPTFETAAEPAPFSAPMFQLPAPSNRRCADNNSPYLVHVKHGAYLLTIQVDESLFPDRKSIEATFGRKIKIDPKKLISANATSEDPVTEFACGDWQIYTENDQSEGTAANSVATCAPSRNAGTRLTVDSMRYTGCSVGSVISMKRFEKAGRTPASHTSKFYLTEKI